MNDEIWHKIDVCRLERQVYFYRSVTKGKSSITVLNSMFPWVLGEWINEAFTACCCFFGRLNGKIGLNRQKNASIKQLFDNGVQFQHRNKITQNRIPADSAAVVV